MRFKGQQNTNRPVNWSRQWHWALVRKIVKQKAATAGILGIVGRLITAHKYLGPDFIQNI